MAKRISSKKNKKLVRKVKKSAKPKTKKKIKVKKKKIVRSRPAKPKKRVKSSAKEKPIGKISHYFSKVGVAVVKLSSTLSKGDNIRIVGGENTDFIQAVKSMEIEGRKINKAKKGQEIGLKTKKKAREGYRVYKI